MTDFRYGKIKFLPHIDSMNDLQLQVIEKDIRIARLEREVEELKKKLREKDSD